MTSNPMPLALRRWLAGVLAILIGLGPIATPAYAALIPLADEPLNVKNSAHPNVILTVDDSTSMLFDFLPDYVVSTFCRGGTGAMTAACGSVGAASDFTNVGGGKYFSPGYVFEQYNYPYSQYATGYDAAGPGAGCYGGSPPTCSGGVDPGSLPGANTYGAGPQPSWPNSNRPYEYWLLWPAPSHSAGLNAIYYDPRLTYDPPVDSTGVSYKQMDAGNTSNWTAVPGDPWASSIVTVDLTASVTDGLWCNSDWTLGSPTDSTKCRYNGEGGAAFGTVSLADGQDYTYPWAPPNFTVSASPGSVTTNTYAAQKVTLDATLKGTGTTALWANAQNAKYFYENENVIWCDVTSPSWPQTGQPVNQTCVNPKSQLCSATAGLCQNKAPGQCNNAPTCSAVAGACAGFQPALCVGATGGTCNNSIAPSCSGGKCTGSSAQTCNGTSQACNTNAQTCSGPFNQTCNLPGTQTCQQQVCSVTYSPAGCNLLPPDPENPCTATTNCAPPVCTDDPGTCSITKAACTAQNASTACSAQPGACSISGTPCGTQSTGSCQPIGTCSTTGTVCSNVGDCAILGGHCSKTNQACTKSADCPASGNCQVGGATCLQDQDCPGTCAKPAGLACFSASTCTGTSGTCNDNITSCTSDTNCPALANGTCSVGLCQDNLRSCLANNDCNGLPGSSKCTFKSNCNSSTQCPQKLGVCDNASGAKKGNACISALNCLTIGTCSSPAGKACASAGDCGSGLCTDGSTLCLTQKDCPQAGKCNTNGQACNNDNQCPATNGTCALTGATCTTPGVDTVNCPTVGTCSITGNTCSFNCSDGTGNCNCANLPGPLPPSAAVCSTGGVGGVSTATLRHDADNNGVVCRRNNKASGAYTSGPYAYPSGKFLTPITNGTGVDACTATDHYAATPRHYWKSEVQWCDKKIATAGDKWLGFGTDQGGTCQAGKDSTHIYPRFFQFGAASYVDNYSTAAFQRVDLDVKNPKSYTHTWIDATGQTQTITRSFDDEMTNYANWFAYYRTRIQAVKTVTSLTFTVLDDQYRVGFHTLSNGAKTPAGCGTQFDPATFVNIADFDASQKATWYGQLFAISIPLCLETPTLDAMARIGEYFKNGTSADLVGATDPIKLSCQKNWHMLFTDGFTNQPKLPSTTVDDVDNTVPTLPDPITGLTAGQPWPHPFREDPTAGALNAASDYAMNYWVTDLRTSGALSTDNVPPTTKDPAIWQHLNFAAMSLGTQGKLPVANQSVTENLLSAGTLQWPQPYPTVFKPDNSGVDDLWHAAINGRGRFVNAQSADELKLGMGQILQDITNQAGSRSGVGLASNSISLQNHAVYRVTFQPGWAGTVTKIDIDIVTGAELSDLWEAAQQLHTTLTPSASDPTCATAGSCPWFTNRRIFTVDDTNTAVPFLWDNLSSAQQDSLAPGLPAVGQAVASYLRGDPTNEGVALGQFRVRGTAAFGENFLGDIVDSQAVYVGAPSAPYVESNDPGYASFVAAQAGRPARVYAGGNDGMLHAFDDATGDESWAFVPHDLYRADNTGLGALAYQDGALPPFRHHFYVDSTPRIIDVDFGGSDWRTLLVGGLGKGGKSYYALDVTNPGTITTETKATSQYLWTFTDSDMGYSYGKPILTKTHNPAWGWVMIVSAGYNNPSGLGKIFFVDAKTGTKLKEMDTGFGSSPSPSGLVHVSGYTKDFRNELVEQIYGGDLYGNFWRFDVSDSNPSNWTVAKFANLTDPVSGKPQPVTTPPQIEVDINNSTDRWVFVGTGRLLDDTDLSDSSIANQQQTFYAFRDGTTTTPTTISGPLSRSDLVELTGAALVDGLAQKPAKGWFEDLPQGQRIITPPTAALSIVAFAGTSPQDNPCLTGEPAELYVREFSLGTSLLAASDFGASGTYDPTNGGIMVSSGAVGLDVAIFSDSSGANSASGIDIRVAVTAGTTGDVVFQHVKPPGDLAAHRMSWRLLGQ
jgi:type IV pilus assembly protein PilY1